MLAQEEWGGGGGGCREKAERSVKLLEVLTALKTIGRSEEQSADCTERGTMRQAGGAWINTRQHGLSRNVPWAARCDWHLTADTQAIGADWPALPA